MKVKSSLRATILSFAGLVCLTMGVTAHAETKDPIPEAPRLAPQEPAGIITQAGVGGNVAFARAGVVEVGGQLSLTSANKYFEIGASPQIGYFFADNLQISVLAGFHHAKVDGMGSATVGSLLLEPSLHMPINNSSFVFVGVGGGALLQQGGVSGLAVAPRAGVKVLAGRSGMLTLDVQPIFAFKNDNLQTSNGTVLTVKSAYNLGVGFSVLL